MAFMVLFSTMSFTVNKHYCGKMLVGQSIFSEVASCCPMMDHSSDENQDEKDKCCTDKKVSVEGQNELKTTFHSFDFQQQIVFTAFVYSYINSFESLPKQVIYFKDYSPPPLDKDIPVLYQTFLI